jgi:hypothetical protein
VSVADATNTLKEITMTTSIGSKTIALAGISILVAGTIAVVDTVAKGYLFEIKKATAELQKSEAEMAQARATVGAAEQVANGAVEAAKRQAEASIAAANSTASGMIAAAKHQRDGQVESARLTALADNGFYQNVTGPMFADPISKISQLNEQLVRIDGELNSGIDPKTHLILLPSQLGDLQRRKQAIEAELEMAKASAQKTLTDSMNVGLEAVKGLLPALGDAFSLPTTVRH